MMKTRAHFSSWRTGRLIASLTLALWIAGPHASRAWRVALPGTLPPGQAAVAVDVDAAGDILVAGGLGEESAGEEGFAVKLSGADGSEVWRHSFGGADDAIDGAFAVLVDGDQDVVLLGRVDGEVAGSAGLILFPKFVVTKFAGSDGSVLWTREIECSSASVDPPYRALALDQADDVLVACDQPSGGVFVVLKLSGSDGGTLWQASLGRRRFPRDSPRMVTVDAHGDVLAGGSLVSEEGERDLGVVKFSGATGAEIWRFSADDFPDPTGVPERVDALAVDSTGDVIAAGKVQRATSGFTRLAVAKLDGRDGTDRWTQFLPGAARTNSYALDVLVDSGLDVIVSGAIEGQLAIVKLAGEDGSEAWRHLGDRAGDMFASDIELAANGDLVAVGRSGGQFIVLRLAGEDGREVWVREIRGTGLFGGSGRALRLDGERTVAAGLMSIYPFSGAFAVLRMRGADGDVCFDQGGDSDADGVCEAVDNCRDISNVFQIDRDLDGYGEECDNCPSEPNPLQADLDWDGLGDICDSDLDGDDVLNAHDNCPATKNPDQGDADMDGVGDACDPDADDDGVLNAADNCPVTQNPDQEDADMDGVGDACDADADGDGVGNDADGCPGTPHGELVDPTLGCSLDQLCPCDHPREETAPWKTGGEYRSCIAGASKSFMDQGLISGAEKGAIVSGRARSDCAFR